MKRRQCISLLLLTTLLSTCTGDQWLIKGDFITDQEASRRGLILDSTNTTTSVDSSLLVSLTAAPRHLINCVLAASMHLNGHVSLVDGGVDRASVTLAYETIAGRPDLFFVQIETYAPAQGLRIVEPGFAVAPRVSIHYDRLTEWTLDNNATDEVS